jgi:hypothetical protein
MRRFWRCLASLSLLLVAAPPAHAAAEAIIPEQQ